MGFSDSLNIRVVYNGEHLAPSQYTLAYSVGHNDDGFIPANRTETGYSFGTDYGFYGITVGLYGRKIVFPVENVNSWWRTNIVLNVTTRSDGTLRVVETWEIINDEQKPAGMSEWIIPADASL